MLAIDYNNLMMDRLGELADDRLHALAEIEKDKFEKWSPNWEGPYKIERDKLRVAKAYNKRVKVKSF